MHFLPLFPAEIICEISLTHRALWVSFFLQFITVCLAFHYLWGLQNRPFHGIFHFYTSYTGEKLGLAALWERSDCSLLFIMMFQEKTIKNVQDARYVRWVCGEERMVRAIIIKMKDPELLPLREKAPTLSAMRPHLGRWARLAGSTAQRQPRQLSSIDCEPTWARTLKGPSPTSHTECRGPSVGDRWICCKGNSYWRGSGRCRLLLCHG